MKKAEVIKQIIEIGLVPVVRASSSDEAMRVIDAIKEGGVSVLEITMTVPGAVKVMEDVTKKFGSDVLVGAGTVLDPETARICILAGAQFIVSPSTNLETIALCKRYSVPIMPGALTPTEVVTAWQAGADFVKVFSVQRDGRRKLYQRFESTSAANRIDSDRRRKFENGGRFYQSRIERIRSRRGFS